MREPRALFSRYLQQRSRIGLSELILNQDGLDRLNAVAASQPSTLPEGQPVEHVRAVVESSGVIPLPILSRLSLEAASCTACGLARTRTTVVFGEGNPAASLVVVGEAPGAEEDASGRPFVGRAGRLLDTLLLSAGFPRHDVYICNVLKCRPPGNRNPSPAEVEACSPFLMRQLATIRPRAVLACGTFPAQTLLQTAESIGRLRGEVHSFQGIPLVPTYHPAALLRNPAWIRPVWEDLQRLRRLLDS